MWNDTYFPMSLKVCSTDLGHSHELKTVIPREFYTILFLRLALKIILAVFDLGSANQTKDLTMVTSKTYRLQI